jgi:hypothetical protein
MRPQRTGLANLPSVTGSCTKSRIHQLRTPSSVEPAISPIAFGPKSHMRDRTKKHIPLSSFHIRHLRAKLEANSVRDEVTGCLIWQGAVATQGGYGITHNPSTEHPSYVHHVTLLVNGQPKPTAPPDPTQGYRWECHHECRNRLCCEPTHLSGWIGNRVHFAYHAGERAARALARRAAKKKAQAQAISQTAATVAA